LLENISVFDIDGEGEVPLSQFKYLMCSSDSGEGLTSEEFDFLLETVKVDSAVGQLLSKLICLLLADH